MKENLKCLLLTLANTSLKLREEKDRYGVERNEGLLMRFMIVGIQIKSF
jgi:hypothetical protein